MRLLELLQKRASIRNFSAKKVARDKIERCLEAVRLSPSSNNSQPWKFIVVDDAVLKEKIAQATYSQFISSNKFVLSAPVLVVVLVDKGTFPFRLCSALKQIPYHYIDIGIAVGNFCLQVVEEGLGSCILGWFAQRKVQTVLNLSKKAKVALLIAVGHCAKRSVVQKNRKKLSQIRKYNC